MSYFLKRNTPSLSSLTMTETIQITKKPVSHETYVRVTGNANLTYIRKPIIRIFLAVPWQRPLLLP